MARYKAKATLWLNGRRIRPEQEFESDARPGKSWEALDVEPSPAPVVAEEPEAVPAPSLSEDKPARKLRGKGAE